MHLRSKRIVLNPQKLHRGKLSSTSSRRSQNCIIANSNRNLNDENDINEGRKKKLRFSGFPVDSEVLRPKETENKIHCDESPPSIMESKRMKEDETFVVGRRMTRAMDGEETQKLMLLKAMDAPSSNARHESRDKRRDFWKNKDADKHIKIRVKAVEKSGSKILPQRRETIGVYARNFRPTRLQVKKQEEYILQRGCMDTSQEEIVHHCEKIKNGKSLQMELNHRRLHPLLSSSLSTKNVSARGKEDVNSEDVRSAINDGTALINSKGIRPSENHVCVKDLYPPSRRKNVDKFHCKNEISLVLRNKGQNSCARDDVHITNNKKESKKTCLSQEKLCLGDNDLDNANYDPPGNLNLLEEIVNIGELDCTKERTIKKREDRFQRDSCRKLRNSKTSVKNSGEEPKDDRSHILLSSRIPEEEHVQKSEEQSIVVASRSSKRKRLNVHNLDNKREDQADGNILSLNPSVENEESNIEVMEKTRNELETNKEADVIAKNVSNSTDVLSTEEDCLLELDTGNIKFDPSSKWCLIRTDPSETGGRQMRPRPLCLEQPLVVLVEGKDQDYYDLDGGSFYETLQQGEVKLLATNKIKMDRKLSKLSTTGPGESLKTISIPSFRSTMKSDGVLSKAMPVYTLPKSYIKAVPEVHSAQPEYDIDEEDEEWLNRYNRTVSPTSTLSLDQYEKIVDLLEKKVDNSIDVFSEFLEGDEKYQSEYEECCICNGGENSAENLILQCADCHIHVHQFCYGVQYFEIGQRKQKWRCRKCEAIAAGSEKGEISCALCCKEGGALKPATEPHKWAHVVCALYTNETYFMDTDAMEPIEGLDAADARAKRQRRECFLCGKREGCAERCSVPGCKATFHVSCGVIQGASFKLLHSNQQVTSVLIYCPKHASKPVDFQSTSLEKGDDDRHWKVPKRSHRKDRSQRFFKGESNNGGKANGKDRKTLQYLMTGEVSNFDNFNGADERSSQFVEGIYLHWLSKRNEFGGSLLHHIQQEHATKHFRIFNPVDDVMAEESVCSEDESSKDMGDTSDEMVPIAWQQLKTIRQISHLVVQREKLKLGLHLVDQDIIKANLEALKAEGDTVRLCSACKKPHLSLICTVCNRSTCFYCFKKVNQRHSWLSSLKLPQYVCPECEKQDLQTTRRDSTCRYPKLGDCENNSCLAGPIRNCSLMEVNCNDGFSCPTKKKPFMLLPRTDSVKQDKLVIEAFWQQNHLKKTILITDILKGIGETCYKDDRKQRKY